MVKNGRQGSLDSIGTSHDGKGAIGEDIWNGGALSFQAAIVSLFVDLVG